MKIEGPLYFYSTHVYFYWFKNQSLLEDPTTHVFTWNTDLDASLDWKEWYLM